MKVLFRPMAREDWSQVAEIYKQGIETKNATFATEIPSWDNWDSGHLRTCRIVAIIENSIVGWAALIPVSARKVYSGVGEVSIYISDKFKGLGVGTKTLEKLITESEKEGFWTLQAVIFPENTASLKMHINHGFRTVGSREKIGQMDGFWRDTILLERRSKRIGNRTE